MSTEMNHLESRLRIATLAGNWRDVLILKYVLMEMAQRHNYRLVASKIICYA